MIFKSDREAKKSVLAQIFIFLNSLHFCKSTHQNYYLLQISSCCLVYIPISDITCCHRNATAHNAFSHLNEVLVLGNVPGFYWQKESLRGLDDIVSDKR